MRSIWTSSWWNKCAMSAPGCVSFRNDPIADEWFENRVPTLNTPTMLVDSVLEPVSDVQTKKYDTRQATLYGRGSFQFAEGSSRADKKSFHFIRSTRRIMRRMCVGIGFQSTCWTINYARISKNWGTSICQFDRYRRILWWTDNVFLERILLDVYIKLYCF